MLYNTGSRFQADVKHIESYRDQTPRPMDHWRQTNVLAVDYQAVHSAPDVS